ncbi:MAG: FGGY family carbohydrate kinase [Planctomycetaceae bacterium]|nr:FGGY family carbohydrate kinase [Planctomycetaceae bacterium]
MTDKPLSADDLSVGIDLGTGSLKVTAVDSNGTVMAQSRAEYPTAYPKPGWAQQNPLDWAAALQTAMHTLVSSGTVIPARIRAIGLCGMAHIPVLLDENCQATYPAILWNDCRSGNEVEYLQENCGSTILQRTSNKSGCTWTLPQLLWLRRNVPDAICRTKTFLTAKDFLVYLLTGKKTCDEGSAAATMLYDFNTDEWVDELLEQTRLPPEVFPPVFKPNHIVGTTTADATRFGFAAGTPVVLGCLDSVAEMLAAGMRNENDSIVRLGSAGAVLSLHRDRNYTPGLLTYPFPYGNLAIKQAGTSHCGKSVNWSRDIFAGIEERTLNEVSPCCNGLFFHPFLQGERAPYNNPDLRGSFIGISAGHRREHFAKAVLEGVCFSIRDCFQFALGYQLTQGFTVLPEQIRVVGGGTRSPLWMSILADVLGRTLLPLEEADSALGAALFAAECIGMQPVEKQNQPAAPVFPDSERMQFYNTAFEKYKELAVFLDNFYRKAK